MNPIERGRTCFQVNTGRIGLRMCLGWEYLVLKMSVFSVLQLQRAILHLIMQAWLFEENGA